MALGTAKATATPSTAASDLDRAASPPVATERALLNTKKAELKLYCDLLMQVLLSHLRVHPERTSQVRRGGGQPKRDKKGQGEGGF